MYDIWTVTYSKVQFNCVLPWLALFPILCQLLEQYQLTCRSVCALLYCAHYPRRARSALGVDTVLTLDVCLYVCMFVL